MQNITLSDVLSIVNNNLEEIVVTPDQIDEDLAQLGVDSISFIRIVVWLEETFQCEIPETMLLLSEINTVRKMYEVMLVATNNYVEQ